jgi:hypothetical protein
MRNNEFVVIKRTVRMLSMAETAYLFRSEEIPEANNKLYFDLMMAGPCDIIILSKIGGVHDARTLFNGANPFGRRSVNQSNEETSSE